MWKTVELSCHFHCLYIHPKALFGKRQQVSLGVWTKISASAWAQSVSALGHPIISVHRGGANLEGIPNNAANLRELLNADCGGLNFRYRITHGFSSKLFNMGHNNGWIRERNASKASTIGTVV